MKKPVSSQQLLYISTHPRQFGGMGYNTRPSVQEDKLEFKMFGYQRGGGGSYHLNPNQGSTGQENLDRKNYVRGIHSGYANKNPIRTASNIGSVFTKQF
jgi:hypothetical protein